MAKFLMPKDFYRSLLDSFFLAASVNCNAYLEFRVQQGIVRAKLSDTVKPGNGLMPLPNLSRPPPPNFRHQVNSRRAKEPLRKRLHAEIATPSPQKPSPSVGKQTSHVGISDNNVYFTRPDDDVSLDVHDNQAPDPPEIVRQDDYEPDHAEISVLSHDDARF